MTRPTPSRLRGLLLFCAPLLLVANLSPAQTRDASITDDAAWTKATEWVTKLELSDPAQTDRVAHAVASHLQAIRAWHNDHPASTVPAGINPVTGSALSELDRSIIADSTLPRAVHDDLMTALRANLSAEQVEAVLDAYTVGKVAFTLKGYHAIVPDLTAEEEAVILANLKEARERAIDFKNMKQISAIFEIYKTKNEQFLNANGRNWKQLFRDYVKAVQAQKAAASKS